MREQYRPHRYKRRLRETRRGLYMFLMNKKYSGTTLLSPHVCVPCGTDRRSTYVRRREKMLVPPDFLFLVTRNPVPATYLSYLSRWPEASAVAP